MRRFVVLLTLLAALLLSSVPVQAITGNYVEDFEHPFVGTALFFDENDEVTRFCSGSLLTPIVFLTAGHCLQGTVGGGARTAHVSFQQDVSAAPVIFVTSDELYDYGFVADPPNTKDLGLVILDEPVILDEYGVLAAVGTVEALATQRGRQDLTITVSGYGDTDPREHPPSRFLAFGERLMATATLINTRNALTDGFQLQTSSNPGGGRGGTCFGDGGGPVFYGPADSNVIVAVTSATFSPVCPGAELSYRTDTEAAIAWILATVTSAVSASEADRIQIVGSPSVEAAALAADTKHERGKDKPHNRGKGKGHHRR